MAKIYSKYAFLISKFKSNVKRKTNMKEDGTLKTPSCDNRKSK
jgi:hypothetical protein